MTTSSVFTNNRTQAVRLPAEARFPESIKSGGSCAGARAHHCPAERAWDSFFLQTDKVSGDFLHERAGQEQTARDTL